MHEKNSVSKSAKKYRPINHTADMGIRVWGRAKRALFKNAAEAMFDLIVEKNAISAKKTIRFNLKAPDLRELFVSWLRELLYQYSAKAMIFKEVTVTTLTDTQITAEASGERIDLKKHIFKNDLKAVTYHGLDIKKTPAGWQAQVIFDV